MHAFDTLEQPVNCQSLLMISYLIEVANIMHAFDALELGNKRESNKSVFPTSHLLLLWSTAAELRKVSVQQHSTSQC